MVVKRIARSNPCDGCRQAGACGEVYHQLGCVEGPSVASKVAVAFLLPIPMFVVALGVFQWILGSAVAQPYQTQLSLLLALATTAGSMFAARAAVRRGRRGKIGNRQR